jgi:hypothetical protein
MDLEAEWGVRRYLLGALRAVLKAYGELCPLPTPPAVLEPIGGTAGPDRTGS